MLSSPVSITFCFGSSLELTAIDAAPHGPGFLTIAVGAAHVHLPAKGARYGEGLDFHENKSGTFGRGGQVGWADGGIRRGVDGLTKCSRGLVSSLLTRSRLFPLLAPMINPDLAKLLKPRL